MNPDVIHRRRWLILAVLCACLVLVTLDNTILNVALPTLADDLDASGSELQWIVDSYVLVFAGFLLTAGALGDRFGRAGALQVGLAIFAGGSLAAAWSDSSTALIAFRAVMGLGGALIMPATLSILANVFTDPTERARAIGVWSGCAAIGIVLGPVTGGWLLEHFWWGSVFLVNVPILAVVAAGTVTLVPTSRDPDIPPIDIGGSMLSIAGLAMLLWAIIEAPSHGWTDGTTLLGFAAAVTLLAAFVTWERHVAAPMLDIRFFKEPRFSAASIAITLSFFALMGSMFLLTQYLQLVLGYSALESGVRYLPFALLMLVVAPVSARLAEQFGTKPVVATGLLMITSGLLLMLRVGADTGYGTLLPSLLVVAAGLALAMAPATESVMGSLPPSKAGVGSAVNDATRELGGALGVAVLGSVLASVFRGHFADTPAAAGLPAEVADQAGESIGAAVAVGRSLGPDGAGVIRAAQHAFVDGLHTTAWVAAAFGLAGAVVVVAFLPSRGHAQRGAVTDEPAAGDLAPANAQR